MPPGRTKDIRKQDCCLRNLWTTPGKGSDNPLLVLAHKDGHSQLSDWLESKRRDSYSPFVVKTEHGQL